MGTRLGRLWQVLAFMLACGGSKAYAQPDEFHRPIIEIYCDDGISREELSESSLQSVAFSPDGRLVIAGDSSGNLFLVQWHLEEQSVYRIGKIGSSVNRVFFSESDFQALALDDSGIVSQLVMVAGDTSIKPTQIDDALAIEQAGKDLISLHRDHSLRVRAVEDIFDEDCSAMINLESDYALLSVSENQIAIVARNNAWEIWDLKLKHRCVLGELTRGKITAVSMNPQGTCFAVGMEDGTIRLRRVDTGELIESWKRHPKAVSCFEFSEDGSSLVSGCPVSRIRFWNVDRALPVNDRDVRLMKVSAFDFSNGDQFLAVGGTANSLRILKTRVKTAEQPAIKSFRAWNDKHVVAAKFVDRGKRLAVLPTNSTLQQISLEDGTVVGGKPSSASPRNGRQGSIGFRGEFAVVFSDRTTVVRVFRIDEELELHQWKMGAALTVVECAPASERVAVVLNGRPSQVIIRNMRTGKVEHTWETPSQLVRDIRWSADEQSLITLGRSFERNNIGLTNKLTRWSCETGKQMGSVFLADEFRGQFAVSPTGNRIAVESGASGYIQVLDQEFQVVSAFEASGIGGMHAMRFLDDDRIVLGTYKGSVVMMDVNTGQELTRFEPLPPEHGPPIRSIDFCKDSGLLVAAGGKAGSETVRVFQLDDSVEE
ncbi:MAG: WD40 repeat domain-containing protein [Planctomycetota bacterium]